jgi:hypothetical protein
MDTLETVRVSFEIAGYCAGITSIIFLALQVKKHTQVSQYKLLQDLEKRYTELLWMGDDKPEIDNVWRPIPNEREVIFQKHTSGNNNDSWDLWDQLSPDERSCYRFTRAGLEILEQAHLAQEKGWIKDESVRCTWDAWIDSWAKTNSYLPYVTKEIGHWFNPSFLERLN